MSTIIVTHGQAENWHQVRPAGVFRGPGSFTGKFTQPKSAGAAILNMLRPGAMPTKFHTVTATACQQNGCRVGLISS